MNGRDARPDGLVRQHAIRAKCVHPSGAIVPFDPRDLEQSIPALFARSARRFRDRLAVKTPTEALTYAELDEASDRLAQAILARRGPGAEPIALLFDKSAALIVSILGVLKAGKIYMPVSPAFPELRLQQTLSDARPGLLVTDRPHLSQAESIARDHCEVLDRDGLSAGPPTVESPPPMSPDAPAGLFYTSGSTGQPKGVVDTHRSLLHFVLTNTSQFHVCALDKVTFMASLGKDIFTSLLNGACVYPIDITQQGLASVGQWFMQEQMTIFYGAASVLRSLTRSATDDMLFPALRLVVSIGEPLYRSDVELFQRRFPPHCIFVNALGSTETTQFGHFFMDGDTRLADAVVPAGYALADKEVILLDEDGQPVGHNQPGKIAVRSRYLADGYWRKPDLTRAKFLPDPAGGPERVYRTGDLGLTLPDGCLLHLGRDDAQVKIRGNRVELEEVEIALLDIDAVEEAVVVTRESSPEDPRLIAYIVARGTCPVSVRALRAALARTLPAHMIPSAFVLLDRVPRIGIGKVDRRALPAPSEGRPELDTPFAAPRTTVEKTLARIWADALDLPEVGLDDHFIEAGGHSLAALQIMVGVEQAFGVEASLALLLEAGTIREMARVIAEHTRPKFVWP
jgi:amino acid adenylation domain-containing protein